MLQLMRRQREDEQGFTLIELMVVVLIIAILIAIAIPTFLGAQDRARDRGAQSDLRNAITAAKTIATDQEGYFRTSTTAAVTASDLAEVEGALNWTTNAFEDPVTADELGVTVVDGGVPSQVGGIIFISRLSGSGKMFGISANQRGETFFCVDDDGGPLDAPAADDQSACNLDEW